MVELRDGELYVHSDVFEDWFDVAINVNFNELTLTLVPRQPLPVQEQRARVVAFEAAERTRQPAPQLPPLALPYRAVSVPFVDARFGARRTTPADGPGSTQVDYSVLGNGDFAFATSHFFLSGINGVPLSTLRLTLSREDPAGSPLRSGSGHQGRRRRHRRRRLRARHEDDQRPARLVDHAEHYGVRWRHPVRLRCRAVPERRPHWTGAGGRLRTLRVPQRAAAHWTERFPPCSSMGRKGSCGSSG